MKVVIRPSTLYVPGTVQRILGEVDSGPVYVDGAGMVHTELNAAQLELFRLKGAAHYVEVLPEGAPAAAIPTPPFPGTPVEEPEEKELTITIETSPGVRQVMRVGPAGLEPVEKTA